MTSLLDKLSELERDSRQGHDRTGSIHSTTVNPETLRDVCSALRKAVEALEWYATADHVQAMNYEANATETRIDRGNKARAALKEIGVVE